MGEAPLRVGAAPAPVSLRMQTSWSKALGTPHQQKMKGLDRAHHAMHVQPLWCLMGAGDDFRLRNYGFTDLRKYPPPSPTCGKTRDADLRIKTWPACAV